LADDVTEVGGTQSIARAVALLRLVSEGSSSGLTLAALAAAAGLHRATAHRLLSALARDGLVEQDARHHYHPGTELWIMGEAAARRFDIREFGRTALECVALETEDTAYLSVRSGTQAICVGRCEGTFPIRTLSLSLGDRRPLGIGSGSLALLAFLDDADRHDVTERLEPLLVKYPAFSVALIRSAVEETRARGYSLVWGTIVPGMAAIGVPVLDRHGHAFAALSVAAIEARMSEPRRAQVVAVLRAQAGVLSNRLGANGQTKSSRRA
jgi:DNA-binding IclR family transcriptional regulator